MLSGSTGAVEYSYAVAYTLISPWPCQLGLCL